MKRLASLLLASALALTAAGCAGQNPAASTQSGPPEAVESGKSSVAYVEELRIGTTAAIDGANVMTENGIFGKLNYNAVVTAPFVVTDENGKVQPFFMTGWELSGDLNTITATFATDQGLTWHDGEPVTMDDVVFTFQYLIDRKSSYCSGLTGVEAVNETTATLTLTDGKAFTMLNSMANFVTLRPEHVWSKVEGEYAEYTGEDAAIGCGPYKLTGVDEEAQSMTLEAVSDTYMGQELTVRKLTGKYGGLDRFIMLRMPGNVELEGPSVLVPCLDLDGHRSQLAQGRIGVGIRRHADARREEPGNLAFSVVYRDLRPGSSCECSGKLDSLPSEQV